MPALFISGLSGVRPDALYEFRDVLKRAVALFDRGELQIDESQVDVFFLAEEAPDPNGTIFLIVEGLFRNPGNGKRARTSAVRQALAKMLADLLRDFADRNHLNHRLVEVLVKDFDNHRCGFAAAPGKKPEP